MSDSITMKEALLLDIRDLQQANEDQARLLAMSADREEKLRAEIAGWENKWQCAVELAARAKVKLHDVKEALK
jgi:hypothetical protein